MTGGPVKAEGIVGAATAQLRRLGLRMTPQRLLILEILEQASGHIAPEELYRQVLQRYPSINRSTVHRTLDLLEEFGLVRHGHVEDGAARYHLASDSQHLHLICHRCGSGREVTDLSIGADFVARLEQLYGFHADLTHFPISGCCRACQEGKTSHPG